MAHRRNRGLGSVRSVHRRRAKESASDLAFWVHSCKMALGRGDCHQALIDLGNATALVGSVHAEHTGMSKTVVGVGRKEGVWRRDKQSAAMFRRLKKLEGELASKCFCKR